MSRPYVPINCEFHDVLEATAIRRRLASFTLRDDGGAHRTLLARIADLHARDGAEYMRLDDGSEVRLDRIAAVDGIEAARFADACRVA
ncbi:hypothetical protein [Pseudoxanthomonas sp. 10H]|uniref:hypothetical protein n=1 Tax=Pseudoxanthomonas sp. 10H TaxID=3242729 RepID=UPI0035578BB3